MKNIIKFLIAVFLFGTVSLAFAQNVFDRSQQYYFEAGAGVTSAYGPEFFGDDLSDIVDSGVGFIGAMGYQFNRYFALEGGYSALTYPENDTLHVPFLAAKGIAPIGDRFFLFGKFGPTYTFYTDEDGNKEAGVLPYLALGMGYKVSENLDLSVQHAGPTVLIYGAAVTAFSATYYFD